MAAQDLAQLVILLNEPGLTILPLKNVTSGEVRITAVGPGALDQVQVILDPNTTRNLLQFAPQSWWANSPTLQLAVEQDWLRITLDAQPPVAPVLSSAAVNFIIEPLNPQNGDLIYWNETTRSWELFPAGPLGNVITSNGPGTLPTYQPPGGGGGGGSGNTITGQTTAGLIDGDAAYLSGNNTWARARSDGSQLQATLGGMFAGTAGSVVIMGQVATARFTTAGGPPAAGQNVYLAAFADDGGTGAGKLTATQPTTGFYTIAGICLDNSNYGGLQTSVVILNPEPPIAL